jgi:xanthine dehydrogenase accessory factor
VRPEILRLAAELSERGEPYALATVVWRRAPSSGQTGATALITRDHTIHGWIGGACAEPTVIREAVRIMQEGRSGLLFLGPPEELADHRRDGVVAVPIACQSEGAMEVFVEPVLPQPQLIAIGRSPAATTLAAMAAGLGWRSVLIDDGGDPASYPQLARVVTTLDLEAAGVDAASSVVIATQGHYDEDALERALGSPAAYIGLVASRTRAESVLGYLRDRGATDEQLARVHAPAGLDLGHLPTHEIAVAVLAEIVSIRAAGSLGQAAPAPAEPVHEAIDPVCGMTVAVADARFRTTHEGRTYYFCSATCLARFVATPAEFAHVG